MDSVQKLSVSSYSVQRLNVSSCSKSRSEYRETETDLINFSTLHFSAST